MNEMNDPILRTQNYYIGSIDPQHYYKNLLGGRSEDYKSVRATTHKDAYVSDLLNVQFR